MSKKQDLVAVTIRFPSDLHKKLHEAASGSPRTPFNTEVIERLYQSFEPGLTEAECRARHEAAAEAFMLTTRELQDRLQRAEGGKWQSLLPLRACALAVSSETLEPLA